MPEALRHLQKLIEQKYDDSHCFDDDESTHNILSVCYSTQPDLEILIVGEGHVADETCELIH